MGLLELIKGKKETTAEELIQAGRDLQARLKVLAEEEKTLEASAGELQLKAAVEGKDGDKLREIQFQRMDLPEKRKAFQDALGKVKEQLLELMPGKKKELLRDCDRRQAALKKSETEVIKEVLARVAQLSCYLEVLGAGKANRWSRRLIPDAAFDEIRSLVNRNWDEFARLLAEAKQEVKPFYEVGDIKAQLAAIREERALLMIRSFTIEDADFWLETGRFPIEPTKPVVPIHPEWPEGKPLIKEKPPLAR